MIYMGLGDSMNDILQTMEDVNISLDGLFVNADAGSDSKEFRTVCHNRGMIVSIVVMENLKISSSSMNSYINNDIVLKEPMLGWTVPKFIKSA